MLQVLVSLSESAYKEMCENGIDNVDYDIRQMMKNGKVINIDRNLCDSCVTKHCMFQSGIIRKHCAFYKPGSAGREFFDTIIAYSQSQINEAEEVKAIPIERLKDFRNEVVNMNNIAIIQRLDKLIEEVEDEKTGDHERTV